MARGMMITQRQIGGEEDDEEGVFSHPQKFFSLAFLITITAVHSI